jgi:hypothetical protein
MFTMFYKIKIYFFKSTYVIGANVMLAASQVSLGSLLLVNHPVFKSHNYTNYIYLNQLY